MRNRQVDKATNKLNGRQFRNGLITGHESPLSATSFQKRVLSDSSDAENIFVQVSETSQVYC